MPELGAVRDYNRIRRFLSHIYLYGFFSREDFARSGIGSAKDYDYGMKLIRAIFPDSDQAALWRTGGSIRALSARMRAAGKTAWRIPIFFTPWIPKPIFRSC